MMRRCVVLFLSIHLFEQIQILDAFILSCNASLQTVRRVTKCPSNISAYEEAEEKKNCSSLAPDAQTCQTFQYHCVLSDDLNYAIEVCAPSMYIVGYVCTKFSTIHKSIMRIDGFACNDSFTACPFGYNSTESFKYLLCYANVNKLLPTELPPRREISETVEPWLIVLVIPIILGISCLIFCRYSFVRKRRTFRRRQGMAQPNFSREVFELENRVQTPNSTGPGQVLLRENQDDIDGDYDSREARRLLKDRHNQLNEVNENPTNKYVPSEPGPTVVSDPPPDVKPKKVAAPSPSVPIAEPPLDDPKDVPPPQATPVDYQSPESFLKSTNVQIQDPNLMSALRSVFNDTTTHPLFPTGLYTVLLIDVSTSINKAMFKEMQHFIDQMVDEVETSACDHNLEEMMAILTFGGRCEVILHFTNDYMPIKDALNEKVKLGGKTPMLFGLAMAVAYCLKFGKRVKVNGHIVNQRILMITDGYPTDSHDKDACHGTDYETNGIKVQSEVIKFLPILERSPITVSCIGVGECNQVFLKDVAERGHGHFYSMSNTQNALKLGRYYLYQDPVTRARTAISQDNERSDPKTIALQHTTATHLTDIDMAEILHLLKIDNDSRNPFPVPPPTKPNIKQEPNPLTTPTPVQPLPHVSEKPEIKDPPPNIPPPGVTAQPKVSPLKTDPPNVTREKGVVPSSPDISLSESDGERFGPYGAPHNRCFPWGTRVIRGEDWKWPDDQNVPGTVVAHKAEESSEESEDEKKCNIFRSNEKSKYPGYMKYRTRAKSFDDCKVDWLKDKKEEFAKYGFLYQGVDRQTTCFHCGYSKDNWIENDDIFATHFLSKKSCAYVQYLNTSIEKYVFHKESQS